MHNANTFILTFLMLNEKDPELVRIEVYLVVISVKYPWYASIQTYNVRSGQGVV